ncbi:ATP-binding protein [Streptomyces iconiensis]|uniref:ATP-binding protein n=1 Tax=Streptomyces iconiensis TaxID=1384038 RepID=A0ABT6ZXY9_9ACTN|nr:ATP-binding protein [Streptomyces iconiensis]MDJ1133938.1 ATP-binding protein [Streptomyces iconiensis]
MPDYCTFFPLAARSAQVPVARHRVIARVTSWGEQVGESTRDGLEPAVSELVTNAIRHTDSALVRVRVTLAGRVLRLEVFDGSAIRPAPVRAGGEDECGRGLGLVSLIADRNGHTPTRRGKVVRAEFDLPPISRPAARSSLLRRASQSTGLRPPVSLHAV